MSEFRKFGDCEIEVAEIKSVHFFKDVNGKMPEKDNGVTIFLIDNTRMDMTGKAFEEFEEWWDKLKN